MTSNTTKPKRTASKKTGTGAPDSLGWLNFWTMHDQHYDADAIRTKATTCGVPQWMVDRINSRGPLSAWKTATQLGAKGKPSRLADHEPKDAMARYLTRDLTSESRAIVREVINPDNERVSLETVATVYFMGGKIESEVTEEGKMQQAELLTETEALLATMGNTVDRIKGKINGGKVRAIVLAWLEHQHRVCVRGTGGVYFIPRPEDELIAQSVEADLQSITAWLHGDPLWGSFSVVEMFDTPTTTTSSIIDSAITEVKDELEDVDKKLTEWKRKNEANVMNNGSVVFSAGTMEEKLDAMVNKVDTLKHSLGNEIGVVDAMIQLVRAKASAMVTESSEAIELARRSREGTNNADDLRDAVKKGTAPNPKQQAKPKGKTGTAAKRSKKVAV